METFAGPEAQIAAIADDMYDNHDIETESVPVRSKYPTSTLPHVAETFKSVQEAYPESKRRIVFEVVRRLIGYMVEDVLMETKRRLSEYAPKCAGDVRK